MTLPEPVGTMASPLRMDYTYVAGAGRSVFLRGLAQRRLLAARCPGCSRVYSPAPELCSRCLRRLGPPFELTGRGEVSTFCVVSFPFPGQVYKPPYVVAHIRLDGADTRLMHLVREVAPERVTIGLRVEPVWVDDDELDTSTTSIRYFRPVPTRFGWGPSEAPGYDNNSAPSTAAGSADA
ncbi:Zn-ribbon domain-containing OB-fold protein [Actinoplanes sp. KI2]|uniref:Zn-ribbon domain-containing OB-fold protein n=1 Tax=Actinoplanes sp. KI2 TaxID=2983315 RepID=UPI0021D5F19F|nr:Zn-ribbon domain-containing OB-fold protein [Actinoplanes sp. KI2]MCU7724404.1 Zn-ribbon domain-containing OB-fold protein [Actinoplanes sp. KI2]